MASVECVGRILSFNNKQCHTFATKTTEINDWAAPDLDSNWDKIRVAATLHMCSALIDTFSLDLT
jgi:hypothetical protein